MISESKAQSPRQARDKFTCLPVGRKGLEPATTWGWSGLLRACGTHSTTTESVDEPGAPRNLNDGWDCWSAKHEIICDIIFDLYHHLIDPYLWRYFEPKEPQALYKGLRLICFLHEIRNSFLNDETSPPASSFIYSPFFLRMMPAHHPR